MKEYIVQMSKVVEQSWRFRAKSPQDAAMHARDHAKGFTVMSVDDVEVYRFCEGCGKPIFEGDDYETDCDGVYLCTSCYEPLSKERQ